MYKLTTNLNNFSYKKLNLSTSRVIVRSCLNVAVDKEGKMTDSTRFYESLPLIKELAMNMKSEDERIDLLYFLTDFMEEQNIQQEANSIEQQTPATESKISAAKSAKIETGCILNPEPELATSMGKPTSKSGMRIS